MKALIRWSAALSLIGGILLGSFGALTPQALALTETQIAERLRSVPVFTLTDAQGSPLIASREGEQGPPVTGVFISQQDAQNFLNNLRQNNPDLAGDVQVTPVSLAEVYQLALQTQEGEDRLEFAFIPMQQEVQTALSLLQQSGQNVQQFQGVPLFIARSSGDDGGYLTVQQGEEQIIPVFFKRDELQAMIDSVSREQPNLATDITIQVANLQGLIQTLQTSDNQELNRLVLVPPNESIEYIRSLPQQRQAPAQEGQTPQPAPAP